MSKPSYTHFTVEPIDIDFAGWTVVEAGEHNQWGVIEDNPHGQILHSSYSLKGLADAKAMELNGL